MQPCPSCRRPLRTQESTCPFCQATPSWRSVALMAVTPIVLGACYGMAPCDSKQMADADKDGFSVALPNDLCQPMDEDCDDRNAAIHPRATEIPDGLDNDCRADTPAQ